MHQEITHLLSRLVPFGNQLVYELRGKGDEGAAVGDPRQELARELLVRLALGLAFGAVFGNVIQDRVNRGARIDVCVG